MTAFSKIRRGRKRSSFPKLFHIFENDRDWYEISSYRRPLIWIIGPCFSGKTSVAVMLADSLGFYLIQLRGFYNLGPFKNPKSISNRYMIQIKDQIKANCKESPGFIMDDFPYSMTEFKRFTNRCYRPSVVVYVYTTLDASLGRSLSLHPSTDINQTRIKYVKETNFSRKLYHKYKKLQRSIKILSQYPMQETHSRLLEALETQFMLKIK